MHTMPPKRRVKKTEQLSPSERVITGVLAAVIALVFGSGVWIVINYRLLLRDPLDPWLLPFWPVTVFAGIMGVIGIALGPEKTMDIFERMWKRDD